MMRMLLLSFSSPAAVVWLPGWSDRKSHIINLAAGAGTNYQVRVIVFKRKFVPRLTSMECPAQSYNEGQVYAVVGNYIYWCVNYAGGTQGFIFKHPVNIDEAYTTLYTGNRFATWAAIKVGNYIYSFGEDLPIPPITWFASIFRIDTTTDAVTVARHSSTRDCNEFMSADTDGTYVVVGERVTGGVTDGGSWPNGAGVWKIPLASIMNTATWVRTWEDPNLYEWSQIAYFNGKWWGLLTYVGSTTARWRVVSSVDAITWVTELDYTTQNVGRDSRMSMVKCGSKLAVLAAVASTMTYHLFVNDGSSWTDYNLGIAIPAATNRIDAWWNPNFSRVFFAVTNVSTSNHNLYSVKIDNTDLTTHATNVPRMTAKTGADQGVNAIYNNDVFYGTTGGGLGSLYRVHASDIDGYVIAENANADFSDIRFTAADKVTLLNHWLEKKVDGDYAIFWVNIPNDLSAGAATIYLYYGNPSAPSASNGALTWVFFDDFTSATETLTFAGAGTWTREPANSWMKFTGAGAFDGFAFRNIGITNVRIISRAYHVNAATDKAGLIARYTNTLNWYISFLQDNGGVDRKYRNGKLVAGAWTEKGQSSWEYTTGIWQQIEYCLYSTKHWPRVDARKLIWLATDTSFTTQLNHGLYGSAAAGNVVRFDYIAVGKYVYPEPLHGAWGS